MWAYASTSVTDVSIHASVRADEPERRERNGRELTLATPCHAHAHKRGVYMALIKVHGEKDCGAHRLPAGRTAAGRRERGRPAGQAAKLFKGRLLQVSKAFARFVKTGGF
ncbi:hypothetical protein BZM26_30365 [Paraburkholderia strydomiana]|nr:hypothetical protein BZM26_30365 [Paraburkholderia strydomiana]